MAPLKPKAAIAALKQAIEQRVAAHFGPPPEMGRRALIETAVAGSVTEAAKISRNIQQALYQDAEAFFAGIDKLASAKSLNEAVQIQSDMVRARGEVLVWEGLDGIRVLPNGEQRIGRSM